LTFFPPIFTLAIWLIRDVTNASKKPHGDAVSHTKVRGNRLIPARQTTAKNRSTMELNCGSTLQTNGQTHLCMRGSNRVAVARRTSRLLSAGVIQKVRAGSEGFSTARKSKSQYLQAFMGVKLNDKLAEDFTFNSFTFSGQHRAKTSSTLITRSMIEEIAKFKQARFICIFSD
jgi:hypothetical protein